MMRWAKEALGSALGLALASACAGQALAQDAARQESKQPFEIVRSIQAIQDQIPLGNASARAKLPKVVEQLALRLLSADRDAWRDTKNARAAVIYTLSGGPPRVLRKAIGTGLSSESDLALMRGTLAYVEGREAEAKQLLSAIDAMLLPPVAGAHVAIIQAALISKSDPLAAIRLLDQTRLRAPGTLVEETALRRELVLAEETADVDKFATLAGEYMWRFPNSVYFEGFRQRFASAAVRFGLASDQTQFAKVESLIGKLDAASSLRLYLQIAQKGIVAGKASSARFFAEKAARLSADGSVERARAKLYEAAALLLTDQFEAGAKELETAEAAPLPKPDAELKTAVAALAKAIGQEAGFKEEQNALEPAGHDGSAGGATASASTLIDLVQQKLAQTGEILERSDP